MAAHGLCLAQSMKFVESLPVLNKAHEMDEKNAMVSGIYWGVKGLCLV